METKTDILDEKIGTLDNNAEERVVQRPPTDYSSVGAFFASIWRRFKSIWTKRFIIAFLCGQLVSLCITCTNVATNSLVAKGFALPTTQSVFL